jgi:hypothetical protein
MTRQIAATMVEAVVSDLAPAGRAELLVFTNSMAARPSSSSTCT